jgi:hypothetical protein
MTDRVRECVEIMRKLRNELHISPEDSGLKELSRRMSLYIKNGTTWAGYIALPTIKRHLHVILPNNPAMDIRVVLKVQTE